MATDPRPAALRLRTLPTRPAELDALPRPSLPTRVLEPRRAPLQLPLRFTR